VVLGRLPGPHPIALACALEHIGRIGHAFHSARHNDSGTASTQQIVSEHDRLHSRAAEFINGGGTTSVWKSALSCGLARWPLSYTGREDVPHDGFVD